MLTRFEMTHKNISMFLLSKKSSGRPLKTIGNNEIESYLLSTECLSDWAHLSIPQRCAKLLKDFGVVVKRNTLENFYKRNNVKYRSMKSNLFPHGHNLELL